MKFCVAMILGVVMTMGLGCTSEVKPGHVGMVMEAGGLTGDLLQPGQRTCWNRDVMTQVEAMEAVYPLAMSIRCKDKMNAKVSVDVRAATAIRNGDAYKKVMQNIGAKMVSGVISSKNIYLVYGYSTISNIVRGEVSKYDTVDLISNRDKIQADINSKVKKALAGTPLQFKAALINNLELPPVVTEAIEQAKKRELQIEQEKASQAIKLLEASNRQALAEKEKLTRTKEAQKEAAYMAVISGALSRNPDYLRLLKVQVEQQRVKALRTLYEKVGEGDKVIVTNGNPVLLPVGK